MVVRQKAVLMAAVLLMYITSAGGQTAAQQSSSPISAETNIRQVLESQAAAWNHGDIPAFMDGYWKSDQTTFTGANGTQRGWAAVLARYQKAYPDRAAMGRLTFSDLEINPLCSDAAFVTGKWQLQRANDHPGGVFSLILRRFPEGWKIVHDHTSQFAPSETSSAPPKKP